jgi:hypothetical protein
MCVVELFHIIIEILRNVKLVKINPKVFKNSADTYNIRPIKWSYPNLLPKSSSRPKAAFFFCLDNYFL